MPSKVLETQEVVGKHLVIEYNIKEKMYPLGPEATVKTSHYLTFLQWHVIERSLLEFAKNNVDEIERKIEKNTNFSHYIEIMKVDAGKTFSCYLEVQIELIDRTLPNEYNCKGKTSITYLNKSPANDVKFVPKSNLEASIGRTLKPVTNSVELYLPTPTKSKISPQTYTPKSVKTKPEMEVSGDEAYIPQSVGKALTLNTSYTATKLTDSKRVDADIDTSPDQFSKKIKLSDGVIEISSQESDTSGTSKKKILFGNDSDLEENRDESYGEDVNKTSLTALAMKYATMKLPENKKKVLKKDTIKITSTRKKISSKSNDSANTAPISGWLTTKNSKPIPNKRKLASNSADDDASKAKVLALNMREENARRRNDELCETLKSLMKSSPLIEPHINQMLKITNYSTEVLDEKYQLLFKDQAREYFEEHESTKKHRTSKYYLAYIDFTPNDLINEMFEFLQTEFGKDDDMGKYTDLFTSLLCPQFAYELFKAEFNMNDEQAERQIKWQDQVNAQYSEPHISPLKSD